LPDQGPKVLIANILSLAEQGAEASTVTVIIIGSPWRQAKGIATATGIPRSQGKGGHYCCNGHPKEPRVQIFTLLFVEGS
jgi:hypothetical protein